MTGKRLIREFHHKDAHFHIHSDFMEELCAAILSERQTLESFIHTSPGFETSLIPLSLSPSRELCPQSVLRMMKASRLTGLGPMAAVAGTMAQLAAERSMALGSRETIVENGGDLYLDCREDVSIGLYCGENSRFENFALRLTPSMMPLGICTSSGRMGHSLSFGDCDTVTVFSNDASLADAAATLGCNSVRREEDIEPVLNLLMAIEGIRGALIIRDDRFGAAGNLPEIIRTEDSSLKWKISRDETSDFPL